MNKLQIPEHGLSLQFVTAEARECDWRELSGLGCEGYETHVPTPTYGDVAELAPDLFEANESDDPTPDRRHHLPLSNNDYDLWSGTDAQAEWQERFEPMMNYVWPVSLAYGLTDLQAVVDAMGEHAGNCTLVELDGLSKTMILGSGSDRADYGIALNGGGMDLSDHIVAAYLCCGCVPPITLLERQAGVMDASRRDALGPALLQAYSRAGEWLEARRERLGREVDALFGH